MSDRILVISDVHGDVDKYIQTAYSSGADYTIQTGDLAFNYAKIDAYLSPDRHKFFGGNHDNYDQYYDFLHSLGDYGPIDFLPNSFFVRGAYSIDYKDLKNKEWRTGEKWWWEQEELTLSDSYKCLESYCEAKPNIVLSHDCPLVISQEIGNPDILRDFGFNPDTFATRTQQLLDAMLEEHQPKVWIFGHYHKRWHMNYMGVDFYCMEEHGTLELTTDGRVIF